MPAILTDIDGVLSLGTTSKVVPIGTAPQACQKLMNTERDGKGVPFVMVTNGGMEFEKSKA